MFGLAVGLFFATPLFTLIFSRLLFGARISLSVGLGAQAIALLVGGTQETHEQMTEKAIKINEKLKARGKQLENVSHEEFNDIAHEVEAAVEALGTAPTIGFYSYGEISPDAGGFTDLHNQTMTITTISED